MRSAPISAKLDLLPVRSDDFDELVTLRIVAMRESLERIGRFDPARARERLAHGFKPECSRHIVLEGRRIGFVVVVPSDEGWHLEHLYVHPEHQKHGIGSAILRTICEDADRLQLRVHVGALRGSDSNRFYLRHGFVQTAESDWDVYYVRAPLPALDDDQPRPRGVPSRS